MQNDNTQVPEEYVEDDHVQDESEDESSFSGQVKVASRIVDYLSSGLYHTPAACLKELVNNAYDAAATTVNIFVKPEANRIIIEDNGDGISKEDFIAHFERISESHKRDDGDTVEVDTDEAAAEVSRPKIGKIGIGMIAANEICDIMEIYSTKRGSNELLAVEIDFKEMRKPPEQRRKDNDTYSKADYHGETLEADVDEHFTKIFLSSVRGPARAILAGEKAEDPAKGPTQSLYGLKAESIYEVLSRNPPTSWKNFDVYSETMLRIALNVPVRYYPQWLPETLQPEVQEMAKHVEDLEFQVFYDGTELFKPTVLVPPDHFRKIQKFAFKGEHVSANGYFYAQHTGVKPRELQGLLVRIRNSAVAEYDPNFWDFPQSAYSLVKNWASCEIWADDGLEDAMNIDRRTLRPTHLAYVELRQAIHDQLRSFLNDVVREFYTQPSKERKTEETDKQTANLLSFIEDEILPRSPNAAARLEKVAKSASTTPASRRVVQRKFSIVEMYEALISASDNILTDEQLRLLLDRLSERVGSK